MKRLISTIHFLNHDYYQGKNDIRSSIKKLREYSFTDTIQNPLLENYNIEDLTFNGSAKETIKKKNNCRLPHFRTPLNSINNSYYVQI